LARVELDLAGPEYLEVLTQYHEGELVKQVPGSRWRKEEQRWLVPRTWESCLALRGVFGQRLELGPYLWDWAAQQREVVSHLLALRQSLEPPAEYLALADSANFQAAGALFMYHALLAAGGVGLFDDMGSGKTHQVVKALRLLWDEDSGVFPVLVICPNSIKEEWAKEIRRWWPDCPADIFVVRGSANARRKILAEALAGPASIVIMNVESIRGHSRLAPYGSIELRRCLKDGGSETAVTRRVKEPVAGQLTSVVGGLELTGGSFVDETTSRPWTENECEVHPRELNERPFGTVVFDEAHRGKDPHAKQTRAVWAVGDEARYRVAMTGTPVANNLGDFWSILRFIRPSAYPGRTKFLDRYALTSFNGYGVDIVGINPLTNLELRAITDPWTRRMPKEVTLPQLPEQVFETRYVDLDPKQRRAYDQMTNEMIVELEDSDEVISGATVLAQLTRLGQFASAYCEVVGRERDPETGKLKLQIKLVDPSSKLDELMAILTDVGDEPVVVYAPSLELIRLARSRLEKAKITYREVTGDVAEWERAAQIAEFQRGDARVMLINDAGGTGTTLTRARIMVRLQRSMSLVANKQVLGRVHRLGSEVHTSVLYVDVVARGTVDEDVLELIHEKGERLEEVVRDRETLVKLLGSRTTKKGKK
jgi:SNF2 family DNA or RNA helicase